MQSSLRDRAAENVVVRCKGYQFVTFSSQRIHGEIHVKRSVVRTVRFLDSLELRSEELHLSFGPNEVGVILTVLSEGDVLNGAAGFMGLGSPVDAD